MSLWPPVEANRYISKEFEIHSQGSDGHPVSGEGLDENDDDDDDSAVEQLFHFPSFQKLVVLTFLLPWLISVSQENKMSLW